MLKKIHGEEGMTMIVAVMASAIVMVLAVASMQLALHNSTASGNDRKRVVAVEAAEAGIDYFYSQIQSSGSYSSLSCSPVTQTTSSSPAGSFTVTPHYYNSDPRTGGTEVSCPLTAYPAYLLIHSEGKPAGLQTPIRKMESLVKTSFVSSGTFPATAVYGQNNINLSSNTQVFGQTFNDADVYSNGSLNVSSNSVVYGNLYVQGSVTMASNVEVKKDLYALNSVSMSGSAKVLGSVTSSTGTITLTNSSHIYGNATASGAITYPSGAIDGYVSQNQGTLPAPPQKTYPIFSFVASDWTSAGYTNQQTFTGTDNTPCSQASTALSNWTTGSLLLRLTGLGSTPCTLTPGNKTLPGNLAIITDGPVKFNSNTRWTAGSGSPFDVFMMVGLAGITNYCDFTILPNAGLGSGLNVLAYTPSNCTIDFQSNTSMTSGQVFGGTVNVSANNSWNYKQVVVPGTASSGFRQDIVYKREVV
jgi:cytoskeletal protein CcmA (bactofilin family)